jgi:hypothetical protein
MRVTLRTVINVFDEAKLTRKYLALAKAEGFPANENDSVEEKLAEVAMCRRVTPVDCGFEIVSLA